MRPTCKLHPLGRDDLVAPSVHVPLRCQHHRMALGSRHCRDALALQIVRRILLWPAHGFQKRCKDSSLNYFKKQPRVIALAILSRLTAGCQATQMGLAMTQGCLVQDEFCWQKSVWRKACSHGPRNGRHSIGKNQRRYRHNQAK